jgi:hypothetical protein
MRPSRRIKGVFVYQKLFLSFLLGGLVAGCTTVGPDYAGPPATP